METEETGGAGGTPESVAPVESTPPAPTGGQEAPQPQYVTVEQLQQSLAPLNEISTFFRENFYEEEPEQIDLSQYSPQELAYLAAQQGTQGALAPYQPMLQAAMEQQGQQVFNQLMDQHEQTLGPVPRDLAQTFAESSAVMREAKGDPVKAVEIGARKAAEYVKSQRDAAIAEYKKSLKGPGQSSEPGVAGGAEKALPPAKSYDEVIMRYAGTDEV